MKKRSPVWMVVFLLLVVASAQAEDITITFTTNVVQEGVIPTGINASGSTAFGARKLMHTANFEGSTYRQMIDGVLYSNKFAWNMGNIYQMESTGWDQLYTGAFFRVESDPARDVTGTVTHVTLEDIDRWGNDVIYSNTVVFNFDRTIAPSAGTDGVYNVTMLLERMDLTGEGFLGDTGYWVTNEVSPGVFETNFVGNYWVSSNCTVQTADNAPGVFGVSCMKMDASAATATYRVYASGSSRIDPTRGDWKMRFWVKSVSGSPTLLVKEIGQNNSTNVSLTSSWVQQTVTFTITNPDVTPRGEMIVNGGAVLIDNVEYWMEGDTNPTSYTDDYVNMLKEGGYGIVRNLSMGGVTVTNQIFTQLERVKGRYGTTGDVGPYSGAANTAGKNGAGIHEFLELCEEVGCEPWLNISGTTTDEEVAAFVEYLTGPTHTTWGGVRADLGHPAPWTDTMESITVEFGNEAWNLATSYLAGGSNNENYWRDLIAAGKAVSSYSSNISFTVGGQDPNGSSVCADATNADAYTHGPYTMQYYFDEDAVIQTNDELVAQYFMSYAQWEAEEEYASISDKIAQHGVEWKFYEYNHHVNKGDVASYADSINTYLLGRGHGVCMANYSLSFLKRYGVNRQCYFDAGAHDGAGYGIKLWRSVNTYKAGEESYRPDWLAYQAVNQVRKGELVETTHSIDPTITTYGRYDSNSPDNYVNKTFNAVYSYGFKNGTTNGLVLINYDLNNTQQITIALSEYVLNDEATQWSLVSDHYTNNNDGASNEVLLTETALTDFQHLSVLELGPCGLQVYEWVSSGVEIPRIELSTQSLSIPEGLTRTLQIRLTTAPTTTVQVSVAHLSGDTDLSVSGPSLFTFTTGDWAVWQTVTLAAAEDAHGANDSAAFRCTAPTDQTDISVTGVDDDSVVSPQRTVYVDFGQNSYTTPGNWNNVTDGRNTGVRLTDAVDSTGSGSGIGLEITTAFNYELSTTPTNAIYPSTAQRDYFRVSDGLPGIFDLTGLDTNLAYTLDFYGYTSTGAYSPITRYSCDGQTGDLDPRGNTNNTLTFANCTPTAAGVLSVTVNRDDSAGSGYFSVLEITIPEITDDSDTDGLPDWWEDIHYGDLSPDPTDPTANGINTVEEAYIAGLDPTDENAAFLISDLSPLTSENILHWQNVSGRVYSVYWSSNLLSGFQPLESNIAWTAVPYTDTNHPSEEKGFYKIEVELE